MDLNITSQQKVGEPDSALGEQSKTRVCRYFSRTGYCREGIACAFLHDDTRLPGAVVTKSSRLIGEVAPEASGSGHNQTEDGMVQDRRQAVTRPVPASRVVSKPVPKAQTQDPREFQLGQIRRRFSPKETKSQSNGSTLLGFNLAPSDPDFPFEMTALECSLSVPASYPKDKASLKIRNSDIPRGFAINVEEGFAKLVEDKPDSTLLELMKALDKSLEAFLSAPKAETIKLVPNKDTRHLSNLPSRSVEPSAAASNPQHGSSSPAPETVQALKEPARVFTATEKAEAGKKREVEVRQLEARLGRLPFFKKSSDGIAFTVQIEPKKRAELPMSIQGVKSVHLFVPLLYPLEPCRIQLDGVDSEESKAVSAGFLQKSSHQNGFSLTAYLNYLAQNMHTLAKTPLEPKPAPLLVVLAQPIPEPVLEAKGKGAEGQQDPDRSHVQYISRPPEWNVIDHEEASESESDGVYSYDSYDSDEDGGVEIKHSDDEATPRKPADNQERGTAISFPFMELYGIELLEVVTLNITVKCERCRDVTEVKGLKDGVENSESCRKCASQLSIRFRKDLVHAHAVRAGFLDLEGCVVGDMLPSTFIPTCSNCSTAYPAPGLISVRGETISNVCRTCHQKFTFAIPTVKFLRISSSTTPLPPRLRRKKETLGLVPGTELPKRGRCRHYAKSYRWFRFSCCEKVYACDKCHDEAEEHAHEWANRMICGWCSREQNYRPEDCATCHQSLVGRRGLGGFWEGGKGTRDRVRMSRKDKRKHRRVGGSAKAMV